MSPAVTGRMSLARLRRGAARRARYGAWKASHLARRAARQATKAGRATPTFLVAGEMKCGSSSLYALLLRHPAILGSKNKEVHYFDFYYHRGPDWYRSHFPALLRVRAVGRRRGVEPAVGEATPYLFFPSAPARVFETDPTLKLIVILRDPVERAYSQYCDQVSFNKEPLPFEEALSREPERLTGEAEKILSEPGYVSDAHYRYSYLARGRYLEQLERWLELFPREQLLVVGLEELLAGPGQLVGSICSFLGVPPSALPPFPAVNRKAYQPMGAKTRASLETYFQEHNDRLYEFLGRDLGWSRPAVHVHAG